MKLVRQPEGSSLCGQACIAMAAGVTLQTAIRAVGHHETRGCFSHEILEGLRTLDVPCADKWQRVKRAHAVLPRRALVWIYRVPKVQSGHVMLTWDGTMYDPGCRWPKGYANWRITSYLEIFPVSVTLS